MRPGLKTGSAEFRFRPATTGSIVFFGRHNGHFLAHSGEQQAMLICPWQDLNLQPNPCDGTALSIELRGHTQPASAGFFWLQLMCLVASFEIWKAHDTTTHPPGLVGREGVAFASEEDAWVAERARAKRHIGRPGSTPTGWAVSTKMNLKPYRLILSVPGKGTHSSSPGPAILHRRVAPHQLGRLVKVLPEPGCCGPALPSIAEEFALMFRMFF